MKNFIVKLSVLCTLAITVGMVSCKKSYLDTNPTNQISKEDIFKTTKSAYTALNGLHRLMVVNDASSSASGDHNDFGQKEFDLMDDAMGNDMIVKYDYGWFYYYYYYILQQSATYFGCYQIWYYYYRIINNANNIIENIDNADGPQEEKDDIKGQALAYRAWALSRLVVYFQHTYAADHNAKGVPINLTATDPKSQGKPRGTLQEDYDQMVSDITQSISLLENISIQHEKSSISKYVAYGIYARIALAMQDWNKADEMSYRALQGNAGYLMNADEYKSGFNSNTNNEWIWASSLTSTQANDMSIASFMSFLDPNTSGYASVGGVKAMTKKLYDTIPETDVRKSVFVLNPSYNLYLQHKFYVRDPSGFVYDVCYMRSSEMYLIRAEAKAHLGDLGGAREYLVDLGKARDPDYDGTNLDTDTEILNEVYLQRRIELWGEGFAYSDIVRLQQPLQRPTGSGNHSPAEAGVIHLSPNDPAFIFKLPQTEMDLNPSLSQDDQNP